MSIRCMLVVALLVGVAPLAAQGKGHENDQGNRPGRSHGPKRYAVPTDRALGVTREVLVKQGFEVIRVEAVGNDQVVWYRRGQGPAGEDGDPARSRGAQRGVPGNAERHPGEHRCQVESAVTA